MSGILRLESLTKGNTLKQGDKTPLKYRLFDADGDMLSVAGKSAKVRLVYPDFLTIGYEKDGLTVAQDDTVTFTIDNVIPPRMYHVEVIVDDKFIFPSRADESKFTVDQSSLGTEANVIEIVGKDVLIREVKSQVDTELQPLVTSLESVQQSESSRVSAEAQRKIDHANRSAEFAGKADKIVLKNLIENGDFRDGLSGWSSLTSLISLSLENSMLKATYTSAAQNTYVIAPPHTYVAGDVYYARTTLIPQMDIDEIRHYYNGVYHQPYLLNTKPNDEYILSNTFKGTSGGSTNQIRLIKYTPKVGDSVLIKNSMLMNLTNIFGAGNEPAKEEMDELVNVTGYIDGECALNNKDMFGYLLKGIGELAAEEQEDIILSDGSVTPAKTTFFNDEVNLFNYQTAKIGFFTAGGVESANPDYYVSDYIPVSEGSTYIVPANFNALGDYFNSSKDYMSRINRVDMAQPFGDKSIFVVPSGVSMVRVNGYRGTGANVSTPLERFMLVPSNVYPSQYIPFGSLPKIKEQYIPKSEDVMTNALYGKKILWNGDSLMMATPDPEGGWAGRIAKGNSMISTNYAVGGGTIATGTYAGEIPRHWISKSVEIMDDNADYVILEGGRNDWALDVPLGEITSGYTNVFDDATFCGAFESMLSKVRKKYLGKKVGFIIVFKMEGQHYPYGASSPKAEVYYDKAREILEKWSVPYLDLFKSSNLTVEIPEVKAKYFVDQTHINAEGYKVTADQVERWMMTL